MLPQVTENVVADHVARGPLFAHPCSWERRIEV